MQDNLEDTDRESECTRAKEGYLQPIYEPFTPAFRYLPSTNLRGDGLPLTAQSENIDDTRSFGRIPIDRVNGHCLSKQEQVRLDRKLKFMMNVSCAIQ